MEQLTYKKVDDYLIPNIALSENDLTTDKPNGIWARRRLQYLKEHRPILYSNWLLSSKLYKHLREVDAAAFERQQILMRQLMEAQGITEQLKADDQMFWVGRVNNIRACVEEIMLAELIFS